MKQVARFLGKVNQLNLAPSPSFVTLTDTSNGKVVNTSAETEQLTMRKLKSGDEFEIIVFESVDGKISLDMRKLQPLDIGDFNI